MPHTVPSASSTGLGSGDVAPQTPREHFRVVVIGAGFAGLGMAVALRREGINDFVVLERGDDVGGAWRDNTYPGCGCDVPSQLYSFSFAQNPGWSRSFSGQPEIFAYLRDVADRYDLRANLRTGHEVLDAIWDEPARRWTLVTTRGTVTADLVVSAAGALADPALPDVPGLAGFQGEVFHSAVWRHDLDLTGKKVAVIGTGASAVQFVPVIAPDVERLTLLQRTAPWVIPRVDRPITRTERKVYTRFPSVQKMVRGAVYSFREMAVPFMTYLPVFMNVARALAEVNMRRGIKDRALVARVRPRYRIGCKRILLSNTYYPALARENVDVLDSGLAEITPTGVVTADGRSAEADVIVFGTGFSVNDQPIARRITGRDGVKLSDHFARHGMTALRGTSIPGYPNLFFLIGPNTGLGHTSMIYMIESQVAYVLDAVRQVGEQGITRLEARARATRSWNETLQQRLRHSVWSTGGCSSWYLDASGRNRTLWPGSTLTFRRETRRIDLAEYATSSRIVSGVAR